MSKHKAIKKFSIEGTTTPHHRLKTRDDMIRVLDMQMRDEGCIPIDLAPVFTSDYNEEREEFSFELTVYAVYVGRVKSKQYEVWQGNAPRGRRVSRV